MTSGDDRPRIEDALLEESVEDLYEHAPCGYLSTLPDGTIVKANQTFVEWTGATRELLLAGTKFQTLLSIGSRIYYETHYAPLLRMQGFVNEIALEIMRRDGRILPVLVNSRQKRDGQARRCSTASRCSVRPIAVATSESCCWQGGRPSRSRRIRPISWRC